jgi:hypothetical protein
MKFENPLTEIASFGYLVVAGGLLGTATGDRTNLKDGVRLLSEPAEI